MYLDLTILLLLLFGGNNLLLPVYVDVACSLVIVQGKLSSFIYQVINYKVSFEYNLSFYTLQ